MLMASSLRAKSKKKKLVREDPSLSTDRSADDTDRILIAGYKFDPSRGLAQLVKIYKKANFFDVAEAIASIPPLPPIQEAVFSEQTPKVYSTYFTASGVIPKVPTMSMTENDGEVGGLGLGQPNDEVITIQEGPAPREPSPATIVSQTAAAPEVWQDRDKGKAPVSSAQIDIETAIRSSEVMWAEHMPDMKACNPRECAGDIQVAGGYLL